MKQWIFVCAGILAGTFFAMAQQTFAPFIYGVASGDPLTDRIILWTKLAPADTTVAYTVNWRIATDTGFTQIINSGSVTTDSISDFTVKTDATGLQPNTIYYYDFESNGVFSAQGRTKTAPTGNINQLRFAVATCAKFSKGYFNAYGRIADRDDLDAVIHLGDYIYESNQSNDDIRPMEPNLRCETLPHFRTRYKQYHTDPDLIRARQLLPWINVWDDHETGNDCWLNGSEHFPDSADYALVKEAATKAYFEWMPIRQDSVNPSKIYRDFSFGNLADLVMLDTRREGREQQLIFIPANTVAINDTNRTILGNQQFNWLTSKLSASTAKWRLIGQQVMMAPALLFNTPVNEDQWDGYPAERTKLYNHILNNDIKNVVVLTGDIHASFANNLPYDIAQYNDTTGAGSVGVEFITPAICSSESPFSNISFSGVKMQDPHIQWADFVQNGYMILNVTPQKVQGDFYFVITDSVSSFQTAPVSMFTLDGTRYFYRDSTLQTIELIKDLNTFSVYPNPTNDVLTVKTNKTFNEKIYIEVIDYQSKKIKPLNTYISPGETQAVVNTNLLNKGNYILNIYSEKKFSKLVRFMVTE